MAKIIGVKFKNTAKIYYFSPEKGVTDYKENDGVVVETSKGLEYATVVFGVKEKPDSEITHPLKPIVRKVTEKDKQKIEENNKKIPEALHFAEKKAAELKLEMKIIGCEFSFDGKKLTYFFSADNRVDFRELVKVLAQNFHLRIELRQVGIRDETKILGGIAPCGRTCCCASCMSDFGKVTIKMAKNQGLHLNPSKISGLCGRLMCCLEYENDYYEKAVKKVPKIGSTVGTPDGEGVVVSNDMLKMITKVKIGKEGNEVYKDFPVDRLKFKKTMGGDKNEKPAKNEGSDDFDEESIKNLE